MLLSPIGFAFILILILVFISVSALVVKKTGHLRLQKTLIILVIVIFLAFLFGAQTNGPAPDLDKYNLSKAKQDIESISTSLVLFKAENYYYPTTNEGLDSLLNNPNPEKYKNWKQHLGKYPLDPWGESYKYRYPGFNGEFDLFTFGPDGIRSEDDIGNWEIDK